ncbi:MAG: UvrD-helicase domain-containing protein [Acidobacteriota bacterium]
MSRERRQADADARRTAQREFVQPLVLEAGAGTGKTTTLVARILSWCLGPGWERSAASQPDEGPERCARRVLSRIVAITFTEAAAAEMATRVSRHLADLASGHPPPSWLWAEPLPEAVTLRARAGHLLAALDHLVVQTFHAFCRGLLADHPLEAGIHPELTVDADGAVLDEVVRETLEAALPTAYGEPGIDAYLELASQGYGPSRLLEAVLQLATEGCPAAAFDDDPLGPTAVSAFLERLLAAVRQQLAAMGEAFDRVAAGRIKNALALRTGLQAVAEQLAATMASPEIVGSAFEVVVQYLHQELPERLVNHLKKWSKGRFSSSEEQIFEDREDAVRDSSTRLYGMLSHLGKVDPRLLRTAREAIAPLLAKVEAELQRRGVLTFQDLLVTAGRLLRERPGVCTRRRRAIDQLLVDEFQDTDPWQCEIVRLLALTGPEEERPGLFLVGDPKQSIYGWRSADLAAYDEFVEQVVAAGGERRSLVENFRSVPAILDEVTRVIAPVMLPARGLQPPYEELLPCSDRAAAAAFEAGDRRAIEYWVSWAPESDGGQRPSTLQAAQLEAEAMARDILLLHEREAVPWSAIGILLRSTGDLDLYLEALRRLRVPFAVGRDKQYYRRREIIEAAALVRTILDPGDHLALLTVLRSAFVGAPDAALVPLWRREFPRLMTELTGHRPEPLEALGQAVSGAVAALPGDVPGLDRIAGWEASLLAFVEHVAVAREAFEAMPADLFVETLQRLFLVEVSESARYLGPYRLANLERFFQSLLDTLEAGGGNATALLRMLRTSIAEAIEAEEARPEDGQEDAVQVMTIHTAKGLDFEHVYVAQLHKRSGGDFGPTSESERLAEGWEYRLLGAPSLGWDRVVERREAVEAAERVRTLYVAMTRAKDRLVLAGAWPESPRPQAVERANSHLDLLAWRSGGPPPLDSLWPTGEAAPDADGVLWRAPALATVEEASEATWIGAPGEGDEPTVPGPQAVRALAEELRRRSRQATERMARPLSLAVSEESHEELREQLVAQRLESTTGEPSTGAGMAFGDAIHRALEELDPKAPRGPEVDRLLAAIPELGEAGRKLLNRFLDGPLGERFRDLAPHVLARELPLLLPPSGEALAFRAGALDLLYRDPESGQLVVVDFKTDELATKADLPARAEAYGHQVELYRRAVREALDESSEPRVELWFLSHDHIVEPGASQPMPPPEGRGPQQQSLFPELDD